MSDARVPDGKGKGVPTPLSLLERARARDEGAWGRLVALYRPLVLFWCRRGGVPGSEIEDVAQDVFAAVARDLASFRRDRPGDTFQGWLRVVTRHQVLTFIRRNQSRTVAPGGDRHWRQLQSIPDLLSGPQEGEEAEIREVYHLALELVQGEVEPNTWQAFWLTTIEGRSSAAVGVELGMSVGTVRQARSRVLRRLKEELGELLE
jgi:RNA polymerase sigma-70 factor (ECF subfamily)